MRLPVKKKRPFGLLAIVFYKAFVASLLMVTALSLVLALRNYEGLQNFAESYQIEGKSALINWGLERLTNMSPRALKLGGLGVGVYAAVTAVEAVGLWFEQRWAHILVIGLVGISIPPEIYELFKGFSLLKFVVFVINVAAFTYLWRNFPKHPHPAGVDHSPQSDL
jgi:uncharacterized membrane protein (DUF2068 family)